MKARALVGPLCLAFALFFATPGHGQTILLNGNGYGKGGKPKPTPTPKPTPVPSPNLDPDYLQTSGTTSWSDAANWNPPTVPNAADAQAVFFTPTGNQVVTLDGSKTVGSLSLTNNGSFTWMLAPGTGGSLIFQTTAGNAGLSVTGTGFATNEISANVVLNNTLSFSGGNSITISGAVSGAGGIIAGGGTLKLSGNNSYTGGNTVSSGLLWAGSSNALGSSSNSLTINGGILDLGGNNITVGNLTGSGGNIWNNLNAPNTAVTLTIGSGNGGGGNYQGVIKDNNGASNGTLALTKIGTGTITLSGANTYTGGTTINGGTLVAAVGSLVSVGGTITVNNTGSMLSLSGIGNHIGDNLTLNLNGGTYNTNGLSETTGVLTLTSNSFLDLGNGASLANLGSVGSLSGTLRVLDWSGTLITGNGTDQLLFSNNVQAVQALPDVFFVDPAGLPAGTYTAVIAGLNNSELVPGVLVAVPEPSTWIASVLAAAVVGFSLRSIRTRRNRAAA